MLKHAQGTKFNEALTKPYHGLIEIFLQIDLRYHSNTQQKRY